MKISQQNLEEVERVLALNKVQRVTSQPLKPDSHRKALQRFIIVSVVSLPEV